MFTINDKSVSANDLFEISYICYVLTYLRMNYVYTKEEKKKKEEEEKFNYATSVDMQIICIFRHVLCL